MMDEQSMGRRGWIVGIGLVVAAAIGLGAGYLIWGWPTNWYARDVTNLPAGPEDDLIRYGHALDHRHGEPYRQRTPPIRKCASPATTSLA